MPPADDQSDTPTFTVPGQYTMLITVVTTVTDLVDGRGRQRRQHEQWRCRHVLVGVGPGGHQLGKLLTVDL